jgi:phosphoglycolate phosphatase
MSTERIIFDLDGTLIDSSPSILDAFATAFEACGHEPARPLTPAIIGPPLMATLEILSGSKDPLLLNALAAAFKERYDREGHLSTLVFPGIDEMLQGLVNAGIDLSIATNKRLVPTQNILTHLDWTRYFSSINALDSFTPALSSKSEMLRRLTTGTSTQGTTTPYYIGDRNEDGAAAGASQLPFILALWGYGPAAGSTFPADWVLADSPADILRYFLNMQRSTGSRPP